MSIKVLDCSDYLVRGKDAEHFYKGLHCYIDSLTNFKSWIDKQGNESAIANIEEEIRMLRLLSLRMYETCIQQAQMKCFRVEWRDTPESSDGKETGDGAL